MKIAMFAFSPLGEEALERLRLSLAEEDHEIISYVKHRTAKNCPEETLAEAAKRAFAQTGLLVFFCAAGIAVRAIAPYLKHKSEDPAVVVLDEKAAFCISLLSGHMGGANWWAEKIARFFGAVPVITTATDCEGKFSVDEYARRKDYVISDWKAAKDISARLLAGEPVYAYTEYSGTDLPKDIIITENPDKADLLISSRFFPATDQLQLIPKALILGIGCKKGTSKEQIGQAVEKFLEKNKYDIRGVSILASIDLKKEEQGLLAFCKETSLSFLTFSAEELLQVKGTFSNSDFVRSVTGVDCVCERSVVCAGGKLIAKKTITDGITLALGIRQTEEME